jgi:hypothetical protein
MVKKTKAVKEPKAKKSKKSDKVVTEQDNAPLPAKALHGELFWEYRAKTAEYEKMLLEHSIASKELKTELSDPKYKKVVDLMAQDEALRAQLKEYASLLRGAQLKAAAALGIPVEVFLKDCFIDHETGVVRIID